MNKRSFAGLVIIGMMKLSISARSYALGKNFAVSNDTCEGSRLLYGKFNNESTNYGRREVSEKSLNPSCSFVRYSNQRWMNGRSTTGIIFNYFSVQKVAEPGTGY